MNDITIRYISAFFVLIVLFGTVPNPAVSKSNPVDIPVAARLVLSKAGELINAGSCDEALKMLKDFRNGKGVPPALGEDDPKGRSHPEVLFAIGTCYLLRQEHSDAAAAFGEALKRNPTHVSAWLNLAKASYELKDYSRAAACFLKAYENSTGKKAAYIYYSASAFLMAEKTEPSLSAFEELFKYHPEDIQPSWRENYVYALLNAGRPRSALPHIQFLAEHYAGDKRVQWQEILLHHYLELDMQTRARDYALFLTIQSPTTAKWWKALSHVELRSGRYEQAVVPLMIYSYLTPLNLQEKKLLADLFFQLGIPVKAAPLYEALLEKGTDSGLLANLARALQQTGETESALEQLDRFAPDSGDPSLIMLRGDLLYAMEKFDKAADAYRRAAEADDKKAGRAWLMAGYAAMEAKDTAYSRKALERAAAFKQHKKAALLALRQLPAADEHIR